MAKDLKKKIESLRQKIRRHDYLYYVLSQPEISDKEYDDLMRELRKLEDDHPEFKSPDSPSERLSAGVLEGFKTVKHKQKMLSLDNTYSVGELQEWEERVRKGLGGNKCEYVVEYKIDGVSASITYVNGRLSLGATRGDGETGEDVTANIKTIRAIPLLLAGERLPGFIEIRGEVYMERKSFEILNREREEEGEIIFANPRNATSGSLKLLDASLVAKRRLNFVAHSLGEYRGTDIVSQWDFLQKLKNWGLRTSPQAKLCRDIDEVVRICAEWESKRDTLGYEVDGLVVKVNDLKQQRKLGATLKSPRWAVAFKFKARQATTEVLKINMQVGRTGVITPVAVLKPVECAGVVISHATLHNFDEIRRLQLNVGDRILIERAGDVIPKVVKVVESKGKEGFPIPRSCPVCGGKVVKEKEEDVAYRCINQFCPAQLERSLLHFASRAAMDIEGMGESVVQQLVKLKLANNFADIYRLNAKDLERLELFKEKKIQNLLAAIKKSRERPLSRLIYALGIRHVGEKAAIVLARRFRDMDNLLAAKLEELDSIYEVGHVMASSIVDYFSRKSTVEMIKALKAAGLNFRDAVSPAKKTPLTGKSIVFTGELRSFSRQEAEELTRKAGGNPVSSVSRQTDLLIIGSSPGSKFEKAKKLGIKIIDEEKFSRLINPE